MFLKTLAIKGFKSFADSTRLDFEPGVTVVVGPNGSGKSNVVDAIAWVLGAQRPKTVRSQKMDDVIFAGTSKRKALGRAEVALTLDNSAKLIPIDFEEVTITRRLFRSGESEYEINGVSCRLLDITELLSDSGVGKQQHVIISQGQIDAVLNARPEERRSIIEEAAGVLKYRRRKEKSERRLESTEANLTRLRDLLREVRRQLKPLERQADAARRHGDLISELTQLRVYLLGKEISGLRNKIQKNRDLVKDFKSRESELSEAIEKLDIEVREGEVSLAEAGADDTQATLSRCESLRERIRGVDAVIAERIRSIDNERQATSDGAVISALESNRDQIQRDLAELDAREAMHNEEVQRLKESQESLELMRTEFKENWADGVTSVADELSKVRGELGAHRRNLEQLEAQRSRLGAKAAELENQVGSHDPQVNELRERLKAIDSREADVIKRLDTAETQQQVAQEAHELAVAEIEKARPLAQKWSARVDALTLALDEVRARSGLDVLSDIGGVVGALLDVVEIDEGYETALGAALGEAAHGVVVENLDAAQEAAAVIGNTETAAVLLPLREINPKTQSANGSGGNGSASVRDGSGGASGGSGVSVLAGTPLREHVRGRSSEVNALLDSAIGSIAVAKDLTEAVQVVMANPQQHTVTLDGASLSPVRWRIGAERLAATGAALEEAKIEAEKSAAQLVETEAKLGECDQNRRAAIAVTKAVDKELKDCDDDRLKTTEALGELQLRSQQNTSASESVKERLQEVQLRIVNETERNAILADRVKELESLDAAQSKQMLLMETDQQRLDEQETLLRGRKSDIEVAHKAITDRRRFLSERLTDVQNRIGRHKSAEENEAPEIRLEVANELRQLLAGRLGELDRWIEILRAERESQTSLVKGIATRLEAARQQRRKNEETLTKLRDRYSTAQIEKAEFDVRLEAALETLNRDFDKSVAEAIATEAPASTSSISPENRAHELERELRIMGPINPLALQEYETLNERHEFLESQLEDIKTSRRELSKVIRAIDEEIVQVFSSAYADVATNFEILFSTLFPGGTGKLRLTETSDLLNTGIEVEARPSGKNVRKLSLLSGGERSLTALAFLFAVFRSRPSPFYVMDEVEAALDDVNLHRFLDLVAEFRDEAQLIIVSHQKRTMEAADCLYGVSMKAGESSRVVSERPGADMSEYVE